MNKKLLKIMTLALALSLFAGCSAGAASQVGTAKDGNEVKIEAAAIKLVNAVEKGGYELVNTDSLNEWIESGEEWCSSTPCLLISLLKDIFQQRSMLLCLNPVLLMPQMPKRGF